MKEPPTEGGSLVGQAFRDPFQEIARSAAEYAVLGMLAGSRQNRQEREWSAAALAGPIRLDLP
jgi:hypothetical protein